ncbi:MAG: hypothetical protein U5N85_21835 [Arcicella sp.]|nr:hypothetical protein [Arcicella sp.]
MLYLVLGENFILDNIIHSLLVNKNGLFINSLNILSYFLKSFSIREHPINKVPMTSIKLPESTNNFREVTKRFTSRKLFLLSGSSYQKWVCLNLYAPLIVCSVYFSISKYQFKTIKLPNSSSFLTCR